MAWRRVAAADDEPGLRSLGNDRWPHLPDEPRQRFAVGNMAEAAQKEQRIGLTAGGSELVPAGIDARAQAWGEFWRQVWTKFQQILGICLATHLNAIHPGQHRQLVT